MNAFKSGSFHLSLVLSTKMHSPKQDNNTISSPHTKVFCSMQNTLRNIFVQGKGDGKMLIDY